jgi:hypothetical protein
MKQIAAFDRFQHLSQPSLAHYTKVFYNRKQPILLNDLSTHFEFQILPQNARRRPKAKIVGFEWSTEQPWRQNLP